MAFTFKEYDLFLKEIKINQFNVITAKQYFDFLKNNTLINKKNIIIKHDIETCTEKALRSAIIENKYNFNVTYYFQDYLIYKANDIKNISAIYDLGHEIAFHYDSLDRCKGNINKAMDNFNKSIKRFNDIGYTISTICPHGNAAIKRNGWDSNKDLRKTIKKHYPLINDIVVDGSKQINYFTDASYKLKLVENIKNKKQSYTNISKKKFFNRINDSNYSSITILSLHCHRFSSSSTKIFISKLRLDVLRYLFKLSKKLPFVSRLGMYIYKLGKYL